MEHNRIDDDRRQRDPNEVELTTVEYRAGMEKKTEEKKNPCAELEF